MLMFHVVKTDWKTGEVERASTTFLHDPDRKVPFRIVHENTAKRYLTGADFDTKRSSRSATRSGSATSSARS